MNQVWSNRAQTPGRNSSHDVGAVGLEESNFSNLVLDRSISVSRYSEKEGSDDFKFRKKHDRKLI